MEYATWLDEHGILEIHKKNLLKLVKTYKRGFYKCYVLRGVIANKFFYFYFF